MKKYIFVYFVIVSLILTACASTSVGIIGGADGPTKIIVGKNTDKLKGQFGEQLEKKPVRMFNVDGELYYDSGIVSKMTPRCGTLDGKLKKAVSENEIPLKSGEANFKVDGYQNTTSITKEVNIDGQWVIFRKYDTYGAVLDGLKYCHYIKGHLNNAVVDSELIVLSEDANVTFNDIYDPLLSSQYVLNSDKGVTHFNPILNDKWGLSLCADDVTSTGMTLKIEQFGGKFTGSLQTGDWFLLETVKENEWKPVETNPLIDFAWNSVAYLIKNNDITELKVEWKWLYGELKPGYYRIKKEIMDFKVSGQYDKEIYEAYFTIEK